jgi:hypothetical protein
MTSARSRSLTDTVAARDRRRNSFTTSGSAFSRYLRGRILAGRAWSPPTVVNADVGVIKLSEIIVRFYTECDL